MFSVPKYFEIIISINVLKVLLHIFILALYKFDYYYYYYYYYSTQYVLLAGYFLRTSTSWML